LFHGRPQPEDELDRGKCQYTPAIDVFRRLALLLRSTPAYTSNSTAQRRIDGLYFGAPPQ
jgi:hypothetical protein